MNDNPEAKLRAELQEKLNALMLRYGILLQRAAMLGDYLRENITATRLVPVEQAAVETLIEITDKNLAYVRDRRAKIIASLE